MQRSLIFRKQGLGHYVLSFDTSDNVKKLEFLGKVDDCDAKERELKDKFNQLSFSSVLENDFAEIVGLFSPDDFEAIFTNNKHKNLIKSAFAITGFWLIRVLESISDGVIVVDKESIVRFVNTAYTNIKGHSRNQLIGRKVSEVLEPGKYLPEVIRTGRAMLNIPLKTGKVEYIVNVYPVKFYGEVVGGVTIAKDVTLAKALAEKIAFLEKAVNQSHAPHYSFENFLGKSKNICEVINKAKKAATFDSNVIITGESGTGKEILAHAIHEASYRREGPFVAVNCAALPPELLESELFGYEEGAFTGANRKGKLGLIEIANHGTLFLDEIGDMNVSLQAKMLRVLQEKKIRRVGSTQEKSVDIRVISATNRDLESMVKKNEFRDDLFYRLNVFPITIPPLRERKEDIELLATYFIKKYSQNQSIYLADDALNQLLVYSWPGNVRELQNTMEFACNVVEGEEILISHLPSRILNTVLYQQDKTPSLNKTLDEIEKSIILNTLKTFGTSTEDKKIVADKLGISLATLYNKLKKHKIHDD